MGVPSAEKAMVALSADLLFLDNSVRNAEISAELLRDVYPLRSSAVMDVSLAREYPYPSKIIHTEAMPRILVKDLTPKIRSLPSL
jgi:hypothetical protein